MQETLEIRIATPEDLHTVMELALSACDENGFVNPNPQKLLAEIWPALNRDHGLVGLISTPGGKAAIFLLMPNAGV